MDETTGPQTGELVGYRAEKTIQISRLQIPRLSHRPYIRAHLLFTHTKKKRLAVKTCWWNPTEIISSFDLLVNTPPSLM